MITITIEETDKDGRVLGRHAAAAAIDSSDVKRLASLLARSVGGLMYHGEVAAETPLLLAAARTHLPSRCTRIIAHAVELAESGFSFNYAVKPVINVEELMGYRAGKRERDSAAQMLRIMGAGVRNRDHDE